MKYVLAMLFLLLLAVCLREIAHDRHVWGRFIFNDMARYWIGAGAAIVMVFVSLVWMP